MRRFRIHVDFECAMTIEMIRGHVQNDGNLRAERLNGFQLKARYFKHDHGFWSRAIGERNRRRANISADQGRKSPGRHDFAGQMSSWWSCRSIR